MGAPRRRRWRMADRQSSRGRASRLVVTTSCAVDGCGGVVHFRPGVHERRSSHVFGRCTTCGRAHTLFGGEVHAVDDG